MATEDFSYLLEKIPGCYVWLGCKDNNHTACLHNANYDFNDSKITKEDTENKKKKKMDDYEPHEAQKETFELISTVKQLKETPIRRDIGSHEDMKTYGKNTIWEKIAEYQTYYYKKYAK